MLAAQLIQRHPGRGHLRNTNDLALDELWLPHVDHFFAHCVIKFSLFMGTFFLGGGYRTTVSLTQLVVELY